MREPGLQGDGKNEATVTSTLALTPLVIANKQRAPVAVLSPTKMNRRDRVFQQQRSL